jgi:hypothetical protein
MWQVNHTSSQHASALALWRRLLVVLVMVLMAVLTRSR